VSRTVSAALIFKAAFLLAVLAMPWRAAQASPSIVIDAETGLVIYAEDADHPWYPASLTKLMTGYLTFEAIRDGKLSPEDTVPCSARANSQPPSKLGLRAGAEIKVDLALKALLIKSANDVAIMLAERVGGSEEAFVARMNETAQRLGMSGTKFFNANGLPHDQQVTTAHDMAVLGRALLKEFPQYSYYYSIPSFEFAGREIRTHNELLRTYEGADGMKTGFICASGYNLVASATRGERKMVAVVLGARSGRIRALRAAALIEHGFEYYNWKTLFSSSIDNSPAEPAAGVTPRDLHSVVCNFTAKRAHSKHNKKANGHKKANAPAKQIKRVNKAKG
jgi:D-alanyl-D-alanine carboxypeptidase